MKVLITGGAGFIGSHIVEELLKNHYEVVVLDNFITGHKKNIPIGVKYYEADIRDSVDEIFKLEEPDFVIHQAAQVSVSKSMKDPLYDSEENILGTINILDACIKYKTKKIIYASTAAIYGNPNYLPVDEMHPYNSVSFYGLSKLNGESYIKLFSKLYGMQYTILRYSNVFGMRQDTNGEAGVIAIFINRLLHGESPTVFGDGNQTRDFIFVKDVAQANVRALEYGHNETFNISTQTKVSINKIIEEMKAILQEPISTLYGQEREGDIRHSYLKNEKAKNILRWQPKYRLREGLQETLHYYKDEMTNDRKQMI
ncbi:NAD-dependent epimerase/dehydratase family protein [Evansella sp. AB-P1]|uniref:NAD-dependent epimerase/dehydratase family protein n=1 Tax=Evansella sp. AB-P1 TaxID=3037653 RepID=UPI00241EEE61|nr:NAD-dependent epimerase/dehydratase family protein [Evansella sp. AB-P1]MDG5787893.1 NAD-dependent epimerase/dehydratase family protein [Evansella sp. AB-P1]